MGFYREEKWGDPTIQVEAAVINAFQEVNRNSGAMFLPGKSQVKYKYMYIMQCCVHVRIYVCLCSIYKKGDKQRNKSGVTFRIL